MLCKICQKEFIPDKYHPHQQVCFQPECQRVRQIQDEKDWRLRNPDYFKCLDQNSSWRQIRQRYNRFWKATHKDYLKQYDNAHSQQRREYMREYMRKYRQTHPVNRDKS